MVVLCLCSGVAPGRKGLSTPPGLAVSSGLAAGAPLPCPFCPALFGVPWLDWPRGCFFLLFPLALSLLWPFSCLCCTANYALLHAFVMQDDEFTINPACRYNPTAILNEVEGLSRFCPTGEGNVLNLPCHVNVLLCHTAAATSSCLLACCCCCCCETTCS